MKPLVFALLLLTCLKAEEKPMELKTYKEVRFQVIEARQTSGAAWIVKIDTQTGKSWVLQLANETDRQKGIPVVWVEILTSNLAAGEAPAAVENQAMAKR